MDLVAILVPLGVCVVLPVMIVLIIGLVRKNEANRKAEVMLKAIEAGTPIDPELFKKPERRPKTVKDDLLDRLSGASITSLMGIVFLAAGIYFNCCPAKDLWWSPSMMILAGGVLLAVGIGLFIVYFTGKRVYSKELESEQ